MTMRARRERTAVMAIVAGCLSAVVLATGTSAADLPGGRPPPPRAAIEEPAATGTVTAQSEEPTEAPVAPVEGEGDAVRAGTPGADPGLDPPPIPEFLRRSGSKAGGPANELNTGDTRARERLPGGSVSRMLAGRDLYHGNYCGPGNRGEGVEPIDALDAICQRHDACYTQAGHRSCGCDRALRVSALKAAATASLSREVRARAASVAESIPFMNCVEP